MAHLFSGIHKTKYNLTELITPSDEAAKTYNSINLSTHSKLTSANNALSTSSDLSKRINSRIGTSSNSDRSVKLKGNLTPQVSTGSHRTPRISSNMIHSADPSSIVAVVEGRGNARGEIGMAGIDLKKPELLLSQFSDNVTYVKLITKLQIWNPLEILMPNTACENGNMIKAFQRINHHYPQITLTSVERKYFNESKGLQYIKHLCIPEYNSVELQVDKKYYCLATAAALLKYVEYIQNIVYAPHSLKIIFQGSEKTCIIDAHTAQYLELVQNMKDPRSEHSLYGILHRTRTFGGARLLRANILQPPSDEQTIITRLNCVAELTEKENCFFNLQYVLDKFIDIDHLLSLCIQIPKQENVKTAESKITNIIYLKHTLELIEPLCTALEECDNPLLKAYQESLKDKKFEILLTKIKEVIQDDTKYQRGTLSMRAQKCFAVKPNINGLLDIARRSYCEIVDDIAEMVHQLSEEHNLPLRVAFNVSRGFFIQLNSFGKTPVGLEQLPALFIKRAKCKNTINLSTEDLIKMNERARESLNEIYLMSNVIITELLNSIHDQIGCLYKLAESISMLDLLVGFADLCTLSNYVCPEFTDTLAIKEGRHPILDKILLDKAVSNNTYLSYDNNFMIITGPNMSGKSTYLKQVALLQIMAQIGSFVPAEYASFRITDHIFSRMGSNDDIETNASTFMMEMREANYIIQNTTEQSLVIIDELGRGTSIEEGIGLCHAICEHLLKSKAFTLTATHFLELTMLDSVYANVTNYYFEVQQARSDFGSMLHLDFTHSLLRGISSEINYGIKLAEISTLPTAIIEHAKQLTQQIRSTKQTQFSLSEKQKTERAMFHLANSIIQTAKNSQIDGELLQKYGESLKEQYIIDTKHLNTQVWEK